MGRFYITTAIDYVNAKPHIGHAYEKVIADIIARWQRLRGEKVFYLTGTDENAEKNSQAAKEAGVPVREFVDKNVEFFKNLCKTLNISNDYFIRTTEERHIKISQDIFRKVLEKGDIYKDFYEGLYCEGCEGYLTEKDLVGGKCPEHQKPPKPLREEAYFFRLSKYNDHIVKLLESPNFVIPKEKRNEMLSRIKSDDLKDLCISRKNLYWGIDVPDDKNHKIYVWFDALINYVSAIGYPDGGKFKEFWPADIHLIGKGINWFHSVIWPAMLISAGIKPPKTILVHGYLTVNGQKISKSLGVQIDPLEIVKKYGADPVRYLFAREIPMGEDGDFSEQALKDRLNNELANDLGNLLSRVVKMIEKSFSGNVPQGKVDEKLSKQLRVESIEKYMDKFELHNALAEIWNFIRACNRYINEKEPWKLEGKELQDILYTLADSLRIISILISPFIPATSEKINEQLGLKPGILKDVKFGLLKGGKIKRGEHLFNKVK
ncbi:MAG: methionine--tRNA ligase [Candidatus Aenigmatarchaeota archaeon]|nr:MAG: methionine--tRNA ligase [Candidatus Aenigmarchaeota archaeon]